MAAEEISRERLFVIFQAAIDESFEEKGVFVLGGCISTAAAWIAFSKEWSELLPRFGILDNSNHYSFKMSEMAKLAERMERVVAFYRVIEKHVLVLISCKIDLSELERAKARIQVPNKNIGWDAFGDWPVAYRCLIDKFHIHRPEMTQALPREAKIDFYFDERAEKKAIISAWDEYMRKRPEDLREFYGATPRFEDDNDFLPLQAADFWVWWVRKWYVEGTPEKIMDRDFGIFDRDPDTRKMLLVEIVLNEDDLIHNLCNVVRAEFGPETLIEVLP